MIRIAMLAGRFASWFSFENIFSRGLDTANDLPFKSEISSRPLPAPNTSNILVLEYLLIRQPPMEKCCNQCTLRSTIDHSPNQLSMRY